MWIWGINLIYYKAKHLDQELYNILVRRLIWILNINWISGHSESYSELFAKHYFPLDNKENCVAVVENDRDKSSDLLPKWEEERHGLNPKQTWTTQADISQIHMSLRGRGVNHS